MAKSVLGTCRSCGANVFWLKNETTGRTAPIDSDQNPEGNITVDLEHGTYMVLSGSIAALPGERHTNHFQTCPHQARWRERQKREADRRKHGA